MAVGTNLVVIHIQQLQAVDDALLKGIWTFLETMYPEYEVGDGDAYADDDLQLPHSNLYHNKR